MFSTLECGSSIVNTNKINEFQLLVLAPFWVSFWGCFWESNWRPRPSKRHFKKTSKKDTQNEPTLVPKGAQNGPQNPKTPKPLVDEIRVGA